MPRKRKRPTTNSSPRPPRGRKPKLTQALLDQVGEAIEYGAPIRSACQAAGIHRDTYYDWKTKGDLDAKAGRRTLHAEFSDTVRVCEARGEVGLWEAVARGVENGKREAVAAGKLALNALRTRWVKRYHQDARGKGTAGPEAEDVPTVAPEQMDLSVYTPEELELLKRLVLKGRAAAKAKKTGGG